MNEIDISVGNLFICKDEKVLAVKWYPFWTDKRLIEMEMADHIINLGKNLKSELEKATPEGDKKMKRKEAYEFMERHILQAIYENSGSVESRDAGHKKMNECFKIFGVTKR